MQSIEIAHQNQIQEMNSKFVIIQDQQTEKLEKLQIIVNDMQDWQANEVMFRKRLNDKEEEKSYRDEYLKKALKDIRIEQGKEIDKKRQAMGEKIKEVKQVIKQRNKDAIQGT